MKKFIKFLAKIFLLVICVKIGYSQYLAGMPDIFLVNKRNDNRDNFTVKYYQAEINRRNVDGSHHFWMDED